MVLFSVVKFGNYFWKTSLESMAKRQVEQVTSKLVQRYYFVWFELEIF